MHSKSVPAVSRLLLVTALCSGSVFAASVIEARDPYRLDVDTRRSLIRVGVTPMNVTSSGLAAAECVYDAIESNDLAQARQAIEIYDGLLKRENLGGDYSGLQWICRQLIASRAGALPDFGNVAAEYWEFLSKNDFAELKEYLQRKYGLRGFFPEDLEKHNQRRAFLEDFVMFMNPRREEWERSRRIIPLLQLEPGEKVADIGSGLGWYTFLLSDAVGPDGLVYAIDLNEKFLEFMNGFNAKYGIENIRTIASAPTDIKVDEKVDVAFMCSLYHIIYGVAPEADRRAFIKSIKRVLKRDGSLVIVDNGPVEDTDLPYHGPYIIKELVIAQLEQFGFELEAYHQIIPQRYLLKFRHVAP